VLDNEISVINEAPGVQGFIICVNVLWRHFGFVCWGWLSSEAVVLPWSITGRHIC